MPTTAAPRAAPASRAAVFRPEPLGLPTLPFGMAWHPRHDADAAHGSLRARARELMTGSGEGRAEAEAPR
ncbi:hypothetical protein [Streptomyces yangpuensis]|uniref:hypothetical protein n=1 Tax=Streptomyces yangpuensis TaxID=1648182 RepID=UPI00062981D1|nr:hypothetical protein [Streptomyces yangpuensis]